MVRDILEAYRENLQRVPFVDDARFEAARRSGPEADAVLRLKTPAGVRRLLVEHKAAALNQTRADHLLARLKPAQDWIVLTPYVTPQLATRLAAAGANYLDLAGNLRLAVGKNYSALIEGRKAAPLPRERGPGVAGAHVLLALAIDPALLQANVRELGRAAGVGKSAAAAALHDLERAGVLIPGKGAPDFVRDRVLDAFLGLYEERLRPRLFVGRYVAQEKDPVALEVRLGQLLDARGVEWAWGGLAAAHRLAPHHRGERTVVHVEGATQTLASALRLLPKRDGNITLLRVPGPVAFEKAPAEHVVPAVLAYAEALVDADDRAREAAEVLRTKYLGEFR